MDHKKERRGSWSPVILILVCSATMIELALQGADLGLWGSARLRIYVYQNSAFWPGLLGNWIPNYAAQPYAMFVTYAFVHGGLAHLVINMITLVSLGNAVIRDVGQWRFLAIYAVTALIGAIVFLFLTTSYRPMVGASGALFGLAGALVCWNTRHIFRQHLPLLQKLTSASWPFGVLIVLNVLMYFGFDKNVAWETHLGGFIGGYVMAIFMTTKDEPSET